MSKHNKNHPLPEWMTDKFPTPRRVATLQYNPKLKVAEVFLDGKLYEPEEGEEVIIRGALTDVFHSFARNKRTTLSLHPSLKKIKGYSSLGKKDSTAGFYKETENSNYSVGLFSLSDEEHIQIIQDYYNDFMNKTAPKYLKNPKKFLNAYEFINNHPALYITPDKDTPAEKSLMFWEQQAGVDAVRWFANKKGVFVEGGPYHEAGRYYFDTNLIAKGKTFEKALIAWAEKLHKFYTLDGRSREAV